MSYILSKNKKNVKNFHLKIVIFEPVENCNILHRHVFVMATGLLAFQRRKLSIYRLIKGRGRNVVTISAPSYFI